VHQPCDPRYFTHSLYDHELDLKQGISKYPKPPSWKKKMARRKENLQVQSLLSKAASIATTVRKTNLEKASKYQHFSSVRNTDSFFSNFFHLVFFINLISFSQNLFFFKFFPPYFPSHSLFLCYNYTKLSHIVISCT
jgi:hypothetical protein